MSDSLESPAMPWWPLWELWKPLLGAQAERSFALAPTNLSEPILPGWTFGNVITVTEQNSTAPDAERSIVAEISYGRQLGKLVDAVAALIAVLPPEARSRNEFAELVALQQRIGEIKAGAATRRLERIRSDLATLRRESPGDFERVLGEFQHAGPG